MKIVLVIIMLALFTTCTIWPQPDIKAGNVQKPQELKQVVKYLNPVANKVKLNEVNSGETSKTLKVLPDIETTQSKPLHAIPKEVMLTIYYEANGEPAKGQYAVYCVIKNRSLVTGRSERKVATDPKIFDPWKNKNPNTVRINRSIKSFDKNIRNLTNDDLTKTIAEQKIFRYATYFHNPDSRIKRGLPKNPPFFKECIVLGTIGDHVFYCLKSDKKTIDKILS